MSIIIGNLEPDSAEVVVEVDDSNEAADVADAGSDDDDSDEAKSDLNKDDDDSKEGRFRCLRETIEVILNYRHNQHLRLIERMNKRKSVIN